MSKARKFILNNRGHGVDGRLIVLGETIHPRPSSHFHQGEDHVRRVVSAHPSQLSYHLSRRGCLRRRPAGRAQLRPDRSGCRCPGPRHRSGRRQRNPSLPHQCCGSGTRRTPPAHRRHAMARPGDGHGSIAGRAACDNAEARALLGNRARLAQGRGAAQRATEFHHRDRRARHPLHSCSFQARERACR